jgi:hypothetical protein
MSTKSKTFAQKLDYKVTMATEYHYINAILCHDIPQ